MLGDMYVYAYVVIYKMGCFSLQKWVYTVI